MDNLTHSLIGVTFGQAVVERMPDVDARKRSAIFWTAVLGNNFPDFDFIVGRFAGHGNLGYLLNHRGHSHTLLAAPILASAVAWIGAKIARVKLRENRWLFWLALASVGLHLFADSWNEYGIHPFWPFVNHWFYGDFIFILEPSLWMAMLPLVIIIARTRVWRWLAIVLDVMLLAALWSGRFASWPLALGLTIWNAAVAVFSFRFRDSRVALLSVFLALAVFKIGSVRAHARVQDWLVLHEPHEKVLDVVISPAPGNPFCWRTLSLSSVEGDPDHDYVARPGVVSLWPGIFSAESCHIRSQAIRTAPMSPPVPVSQEPAKLWWAGEYHGRIADLRRLNDSNCRFAELLRFARIPYWDEKQGVAGDLRYDNEPGLGFAELMLDPELGCLAHVPPWVPPVADKIDLNH